MKFPGTACDECRKETTDERFDGFQLLVHLNEAGKVTGLEIARELPKPDPEGRDILLDLCTLACLQKAVMRSMEKMQLGTANGKHDAVLPPAQSDGTGVDAGGPR